MSSEHFYLLVIIGYIKRPKVKLKLITNIRSL